MCAFMDSDRASADPCVNSQRSDPFSVSYERRILALTEPDPTPRYRRKQRNPLENVSDHGSKVAVHPNLNTFSIRAYTHA